MIIIRSEAQTYVQSVDHLFFQLALESAENEIQLKLLLIQSQYLPLLGLVVRLG